MLIIAAFGRAALFLLALFGLCYWIHRLTETDVHFAPVCALCVMGVVTYAGGIVGALAPATWGVVVVGAIAGAAAMPVSMVVVLLDCPLVSLTRVFS